MPHKIDKSCEHFLNFFKFVKMKAERITKPDAFDVLPPEMLAEVLSYIPPKERQYLRLISYHWKRVIDHFFGIHLKVTNMNWNSVQNCNFAKTLTLSGFSRDISNPHVITSRLISLELADFLAYYSLMPILEHCQLLQSLNINCVTFLQKSRLPEYSSQRYLFYKDGQWLPRLKSFKFRSCTTQSGVYNHIVPTDVPDELFGMEHAARAFDISRGEMEFLPYILQILTQSKSLSSFELILTDIWKIPFADLLQVGDDMTNGATSASLDISLWHFGSKRTLPVGSLLDKVKTLREIRFSFPHHFDSFFVKFYKPSSSNPQDSYQLEEAVIEQSLRWSQEMREVDIPWLQILERQTHLKRLHYPFPVLGNDQRVAQIIESNSDTLEAITFIGHREEEQELQQGVRVMGPPLPWDCGWFSPCSRLASLQLTSHARFLGPTNVSSLSKPELLPHSLTRLTFNGCIDLGPNPLTVALSSLTGLKEFTHQARLCPWFTFRTPEDNPEDDPSPVSELRVSHVKDVIVTLPQLFRWTLEYSDPASPLVSHFITPASATINRHVMDWLKHFGDSKVMFEERIIDRQMKSLKIYVLSHDTFK